MQKNKHCSHPIGSWCLAGLVIGALILIACGCDTSRKKVHHIGILIGVDAYVEVGDGFISNMQTLGYIEEKNTTYDIRIAGGDNQQMQAICEAFVAAKVDLIVTITHGAAVTAKKVAAGSHIPILFIVADAREGGLVESIGKPGGNITGVSDMLPLEQHMQMVKAFVPGLKKLGVIYNSGEANSKSSVKMIREVGAKMGFEVVDATVSKTSEVYQATKSLSGRADAVFVPTDNTVVESLESAVKVCGEINLPLFCADVDSFKRGAVAAMGFDYYKHGRQTGAMAQRIFAGASPADTAVETQAELKLHINLKAADLMGVKVPDAMKSKADKIYK